MKCTNTICLFKSVQHCQNKDIILTDLLFVQKVNLTRSLKTSKCSYNKMAAFYFRAQNGCSCGSLVSNMAAVV